MGSQDVPLGPCKPLCLKSHLALYMRIQWQLCWDLIESRVGDKLLLQLCKALCNKRFPANCTHTC